MIVIHHNKDMDGYASGAICKLKYPLATLIGWDYKDAVPDFEQFRGEEVIMIDITFKLPILLNLASICKLTVIDHHISFMKDVVKWQEETGEGVPFTYLYDANKAACEIGWKYLFPDKPIPYAITLIGRYDTWRQEEGDWQGETLPFKYYMYGQCNSAEGFPTHLLKLSTIEIKLVELECSLMVDKGKAIMKYVDLMDEAATRAYSFQTEAYGYKALVLNMAYFNSETLKSVYDSKEHEIMVGFVYTGYKWSVSLRSDKPEIDVSLIAKARGGGGHKGAAGFEVNNFEDIFK